MVLVLAHILGRLEPLYNEIRYNEHNVCISTITSVVLMLAPVLVSTLEPLYNELRYNEQILSDFFTAIYL